MKNLKALFEKIDYKLLKGSMDMDITSMTPDSRKVEKGGLFLCISGTAVDGHSFIPKAIEAGAAALVVEKSIEAIEEQISAVIPEGLTVIGVDDARIALAYLAAAYFDYPAESLKVIGVTGTKGKTTTTYMVKSILDGAGHKCGLIGTIEAIIGDRHIPAANTTPESFVVQQYFKEMLDAGCDTCVMEVSSQGLMMHRVDGFEFELGIFTNLEPDHIGPNEHASFEEYMHCKGLLFQKCRHGILNGDDQHLEGVLEGHTCDYMTYGLKDTNDLYASDIRLLTNGGSLGVEYDIHGILEEHVAVNVPGKFSVYNSLTAIAICNYFKVPMDVMKEALLKAKAKGRIELIDVSDEFTLMIDYAHNAMALESLLTTLREYNPGRLVCLFGCGGNRAKSRRFEMGEVSGRLADLTIITSDNPRFEEPLDIIADIVTGISKTDGEYVKIPDRKEAIKYAIENGRPGDVIILAGKGHEDYQEIKGVKYPMDERVLIAEVLEELKA